MSDTWVRDAVEQQNEFQEQYSTWKEYPRDFTGYLKTHIGILLFGVAENADPNISLMQYHECYDEKQRKSILTIFNKIMNLFPKSVYVQFNCTFLTLKLPKESHFLYVIFRCRCFRNLNKIYFIEPNGRVYQDWSDFTKNNKLPKCEYVTVRNGVYNIGETIMKFKSPAACKGIISESLDWAATVAAVGCVAAGLFAVAPVTAACAGVCAGAYGAGSSVLAIKDRVRHMESVGLGNKESLLHYANITASGLTGIGSLAIANAGRISNFFGSYSKFAMGTIKVVNYTTLIFDGAFFVVNVHDFWGKFKEKNLSAHDVFNLSLQVFLLYGAVINIRDMHKSLSEIQQSSITNNLNVSNKKLTKSQKRNLQKKRAKIRRRQQETAVNAVRVTEYDKYASVKKIAYTGGLIGVQFLLKKYPRAEVIIDEFNQIRNLISAHLASMISLPEMIYGFSQHVENLQIILKEDLASIRKFLAEQFPSVPNNDGVAQVINNEVDEIEQMSEDIYTTSVENSNMAVRRDNESQLTNSDDENQQENENQRRPSNHKMILDAAKCMILNCEIPESGTMVIHSFHSALLFVIDEVETFFQKYDHLLAMNTAIIGETKAKQMLLVLGTKNEIDFFPDKMMFDDQVMKAGNKVDEFLRNDLHIHCKSNNLSAFVCEIAGSLLTLVDELFRAAVTDWKEIGLKQLVGTLKMISSMLFDELTAKMTTCIQTRDSLFRENSEIVGEEYANKMLKLIGMPSSEIEVFKLVLTQLDKCKNDTLLSVLQSYTSSGVLSKHDGLETSQINIESNPAETNQGHVIFTTACEKFYQKIITQSGENTERSEVFKKVARFVAKKIMEDLNSFKSKCEQLKENADVVGPRVFKAMLRNIISIDQSGLVKDFCEKLDSDDSLISEFFLFCNSGCDMDLKYLRVWDNTIGEEGFTAYRIECCGNKGDRYYLDFASNLFKVPFDFAPVKRSGNFIFFKSADAAVTFRFSNEETNSAIVILVDLNAKDNQEEESPVHELDHIWSII